MFALCISLYNTRLSSSTGSVSHFPQITVTLSFPSHFGLRTPGSSLVLPLRPQQLAVMLMLRWVAPWLWLKARSSLSRSSRSLSDWLCVRSGLLWIFPVGELGAGWEEMVRSRWFLFLRKSLFAPKPKLPLRKTMRALLDLAGRERWLYSSWDKWAAYPSVMNWLNDFVLLLYNEFGLKKYKYVPVTKIIADLHILHCFTG